MEQDRLKLAGVLAFIRATLTLPLASLTTQLLGNPGIGPKLITTLLSVISFVLFVYILLTFKGLLNLRFRFHATDLAIYGMIGLRSLSLVVLLVPLLMPGFVQEQSSILKILTFLFGMLMIGFGAQLLKLEDNLDGFLKPFAFLSMAAGLGFASILMAWLGILFGAIADILLGIIFIKASGTGP